MLINQAVYLFILLQTQLISRRSGMNAKGSAVMFIISLSMCRIEQGALEVPELDWFVELD